MCYSRNITRRKRDLDKAYIVDQLDKIAAGFGLKIDREVIGEAVGFSEFKVYSKGEIIARTGDKATTAGILMHGLARSFYVDSNGDDVSKFFAREGNFIMDEGLMGEPEIIASVEAVEECTVMIFEVAKMKELIMSSEELKTLWIGLLESGMRYKIYRENGFLTENATERYLSFRRHFPELIGRVPQQYIATYLGIKPESLSRIKNSLKEEGI